MNVFRPAPASADAGIDASATAPARALPSVASSTIEPEDWDCLFRAVMERLSLTAGKYLAATTTTQAQDPAGRIAAIVLDCVQALDRLHRMLPRERRELKLE